MGYQPPRHFLRTYGRGYSARLGGLPRRAPYRDQRTAHGGVTYSRAWRRFWLEGWDDADVGRPWRYPEKWRTESRPWRT
jgi:hypothetical protein